ALLELAAAEEGDRHADPLDDVDVAAEAVAPLAPLDIVGLQVDADVRVRLDPSPEHGRDVVERRRLEGAGALEVVLIARGQSELETERLAQDAGAGKLVLGA